MHRQAGLAVVRRVKTYQVGASRGRRAEVLRVLEQRDVAGFACLRTDGKDGAVWAARQASRVETSPSRTQRVEAGGLRPGSPCRVLGSLEGQASPVGSSKGNACRARTAWQGRQIKAKQKNFRTFAHREVVSIKCQTKHSI